MAIRYHDSFFAEAQKKESKQEIVRTISIKKRSIDATRQ
jgi:hypothetical protein